MSKTQDGLMVEWKNINWRKVERMVFKLQKRIYKASERGDVKAVRKLQKTLMKSWFARLLSVRRVTQDNNGKKTAGIDGKKSYLPSERLQLVNKLKLGSKAKPTRRVWIPKPGKKEKRPLGIPTMYDRALQTLVKLSLEPEWEAKFEPNSYGFRPGRSCHDAIEAIFISVSRVDKYVLDADIAGCFDNINHDVLLRKINTFPSLRRQIKAWLKAGVIDMSGYAGRPKGFSRTDKGTPQGGTLSPLLANIALHGMENRLRQYAETLPLSRRDGISKKEDNVSALKLIRYADDFVIMHKKIEIVLKCKEIIANWLKEIGLELKPSKTKISHTRIPYEGNVGFDFLGFHIRNYEVGKHQSGVIGRKKTRIGFKTIIKPSQKSVRNQYFKISKTIDTYRTAPQEVLIKKLNPIIRGWSNYFSTVCSKETFAFMDMLVWQKLWSWAKHRCPSTGKKEIAKKYWGSHDGDNWTFLHNTGDNPVILTKHKDAEIHRHTKVKGTCSPYNGDTIYWSSRMGKSPEMPAKITRLLKAQEGKCPHCGLFFREDDQMEIDHIIPRKQGGSNKRDNLQLLHKHCHDTKTANDGSLERSTHVKGLPSRGAE